MLEIGSSRFYSTKMSKDLNPAENVHRLSTENVHKLKNNL